MAGPTVGQMAGISGLGAVLEGVGEGMKTRNSQEAALAAQEAAERLKEQGESHQRELNTLPADLSASLWQAATGRKIPIGGDGRPMVLPQPIAQTLLTSGLRYQSALEKSAAAAKTASGKLDPKANENVQRIYQAMTNLQNLAQTYQAVHGEKLGMAGTLGSIPGGTGIMSLPIMKNMNPGYTALNTAQEDAKNAYTRATLGRVSGDMLKSAMPLHSIAGVDPATAKAQLDQLAASLKGVANGVVGEIRMQHGDEAGDRVQQYFDNQFGTMRFFPDQENPSPAPGTGIQTNQPTAAPTSKPQNLKMAPDHVAKLMAVPPSDPRYQQVQDTLKTYGALPAPVANRPVNGTGSY